MRKLNSLIVISKYWPAVGGSELHTRELAHRLSADRKIGVVHHCSDESDELEMAAALSQSTHNIDNTIPVYKILPRACLQKLFKLLASTVPYSRIGRKLYNYLFKLSVRSQMEAVATDYDLIHAVYNGITASTEAALEVARAQHKPFIWTPLAHTEEPAGTAWSSRSFRKLYRKADALIAMTQYEKDFLVKMGADADKVHVCPVSALLDDNINPISFRQELKLEDYPVVLFLGRHVADKGYRQLVESAKIIWRSHPQTRFLFIGPGDDQASTYFNRVSDHRIIRIPNVSDANKCSALAACDLLCVPSSKESLGVIYLEAWHYAKPVVAADIPVLRTVISDTEDGLLCEQNPQSIADSIQQLLDNPEMRKQMGRAGQQKFNHRYSWNHIVGNMRDIYTHTKANYEPNMVQS